MPLTTGLKLGPYEILAAIGAGGMGEVYRAKDTRLDRTVAIKVLPSHLSENSEIKQRFEREARTISSLSHPHICALYDVGSHEGTNYLVMEYLEGETLTQRLSKGPLSTDQLLQYGIEIADALDRAHRQGIIHRDLKPGNIMLTRSGTKLLDFGLAKLQTETASHPEVSSLQTEQRELTREGMILGTMQYMAPEQLEGKTADARTDIFALGTILYEMATGKKAFEGKSQASLIAAILEKDPVPMTSLQPMTPPALERLVRACLSKNPEDRLQTAHDVKLQLKWIAEGTSQPAITAPTAATKRRRVHPFWMIASMLFLAIASILAFLYLQRPTDNARLAIFTIPPPKALHSAIQWRFLPMEATLRLLQLTQMAGLHSG